MGRGTVSYIEVPVKVEVDGILHYRLVGPSDTPPTAETSYTIDPEPIEIPNVNGKFWVEYKIVLP